MQHGDISAEVAPRLLIEFEDLLARPREEDPDPVRYKRWLPQRFQKTDPVRAWDLNDLVVKVMWDLTWRFGLELDVITVSGSDEDAHALAERLDAEQVPARRVWAADPRMLARRLVAMPHVTSVATASPERCAMYGRWGRLITPANVTQMGRF
ncbi:hypothetical protein ACWDTT_10465 [Streptosporangium sandarakinum]